MAAVTQNNLMGNPSVLFAVGAPTQPAAADMENDFMDIFTATDRKILSTTANDQAENAPNFFSGPNEKEASEVDLDPAMGDSTLWQTIAQFMALVPKAGCPTAALKATETAAPDTFHETTCPSEFATLQNLSTMGEAQSATRSLPDFLPVQGNISFGAFAGDLADDVAKGLASLRGAASQSPADTFYPEAVVAATSKGEQKASSPSAASFLPDIAASSGVPETSAGRVPLSEVAVPVHPQQPARPEDTKNLVLVDPELPKPAFSAAETAWRQRWGDASVESNGSDTLSSDFQVAAVKNEPTPKLAILDGKMLPLSTGRHLILNHEILSTLLRGAENVPQATTKPFAAANIGPSEGQAINTLLKSTIDSSQGFSDPPFADVSDNSFSLSMPTASAPSAQPAQLVLSGLPPAVAPAIVDLVRSGQNGPLEIALSPEELGRLTISIKQDGDFVHVTVVADRPETLDLMRRHAGDLVADLKQSGFSGASLNFGHGGRGQQPRFADTKANTTEPLNSSIPETRPTELIFPKIGSGLDMRF